MQLRNVLRRTSNWDSRPSSPQPEYSALRFGLFTNVFRLWTNVQRKTKVPVTRNETDTTIEGQASVSHPQACNHFVNVRKSARGNQTTKAWGLCLGIIEWINCSNHNQRMMIYTYGGSRDLRFALFDLLVLGAWVAHPSVYTFSMIMRRAWLLVPAGQPSQPISQYSQGELTFWKNKNHFESFPT